MITETQITTAEELLRMPHNGFRYELVRGILKKMSPAGSKHGKVAMNMAAPLDHYVRKNALGIVYAAETGFRIGSNPDTVRAPDVAFVARERAEEVGDIEGFLPFAPDLAIEVVSPSESYNEVEEKVFEWLDAGCRMVVVVNSRKKRLSVYRSRADIKILTEEDSLSGEDVVPGWILPLKGIFD